jgi:hypothetical protein
MIWLIRIFIMIDLMDSNFIMIDSIFIMIDWLILQVWFIGNHILEIDACVKNDAE